ncbi:MAG: hypothetical protein OHK0039_32850 [Bacteroidia bacterium]
MTYAGAGAKRMLKCTSCSYSRGLGLETDQVQARPMDAGVSMKDFTRGMQAEMKAVACEGCGSHVAVVPEATVANCPFCQSDKLKESTRHTQIVEPYGLVPFTISQETALSVLRRHIGGNWLLAPEIHAVKDPARLRPVYVPAFLFDVQVRSTWKGELGFVVVKDTKAGKEDHKVWEPTAGYLEHFFDQYWLAASHGVKDGSFLPATAFRYQQTVPYDPRYLRDSFTELYQTDEVKAFGSVNGQLDKIVQGMVTARLPAKESRKLEITSEKYSIAFRHILVPVWVAAFSYEGKLHQFFINGENGYCTGAKPLSERRIAVAIVAGIAALIGLVLALT